MLIVRRTHSAGFSLIEVIVTTFIVAVGLLAIVAMQTMAKRTSVESQQRTAAYITAKEMLERVRSNSIAWQANNPGIVKIGQGQIARTRPNCAEDSGLMSACSAADLVYADLYYWEWALKSKSSAGQSALLNATACIQLLNTGELSVVVSWLSRQAFTQTTPTNSLATSCGSSSDKRRLLVLETWLST
ncbi:type IV pilus modification protein PilV [Aliagarivorans taiwanensis]|uniref:type IV pilus modification protein PilV n=1 Tax=Aliagarivorans taiwanensis TaxID=561966 RepID=UPI000414ABBA|nr:type IV pilus modification protein PilV [Aliagarivorans taiwanensis]